MLVAHATSLEISCTGSNIGCSMHICYSFQEANNKFADQTAQIRRLPGDGGGDCVCVCVWGGGGGVVLSFFS